MSIFTGISPFWHRASDIEMYDYLVNGLPVINEIRKYHDAEDRFIERSLSFFIRRNKKLLLEKPLIIIEEGCGPGRIIENLSYQYIKKIIKYTKTGKEELKKTIIPKQIVGIDFERGMLTNCIKHLVGKGGSVKKWTFNSVASRICSSGELDQESCDELVRNKVCLVQADIRKPHLAFYNCVPFLIMAFGTLGNIDEPTKALDTIHKTCYPSGVACISVFNKEKSEIGKKRYQALENKLLKKTNYDQLHGVFKSEKSGFKSTWFDKKQVSESLKTRFLLIKKIKTIADGVGLACLLKPKSDSSVSKHKLQIEDFFLKHSDWNLINKQHVVLLLCPNCSVPLNNGMLPLKSEEDLVCPVNSTHSYTVINENGFLIPVLTEL